MERQWHDDGPAAPPTANGELVFEAPWQGRVFGMACSLAEAGVFSWDAFRDRLIETIDTWEQANPGAEYRYYERFLEALEATLAAAGLVAPGELAARTASFLARPHGHDHSH